MKKIAVAVAMNARVGMMETFASAPSQETFAGLLREMEELVSEGGDRVSSINPRLRAARPQGLR